MNYEPYGFERNINDNCQTYIGRLPDGTYMEFPDRKLYIEYFNDLVKTINKKNLSL